MSAWVPQQPLTQHHPAPMPAASTPSFVITHQSRHPLRRTSHPRPPTRCSNPAAARASCAQGASCACWRRLPPPRSWRWQRTPPGHARSTRQQPPCSTRSRHPCGKSGKRGKSGKSGERGMEKDCEGSGGGLAPQCSTRPGHPWGKRGKSGKSGQMGDSGTSSKTGKRNVGANMQVKLLHCYHGCGTLQLVGGSHTCQILRKRSHRMLRQQLHPPPC